MSNIFFTALLLVSLCAFGGCTKAQPAADVANKSAQEPEKPAAVKKIGNPGKVVHVLVALCDNENQGIVPVPAHLGDGEDPQRNLYWGAAYGVRTFFSKSAVWEKLAVFDNPADNVLERIVFKHKTENVFLVADAYRGSRIKETIDDFFAAVAGEKLENVDVNGTTLQVFGSAALVAFVGHNGLMDFPLDRQFPQTDDVTRDAIILACASRNYFSAPLKKTGARPVLWTSNLMAPEAYILHDALEGWTKGENGEQIQERAAAAYAKYQRISPRAARNLLVTGW